MKSELIQLNPDSPHHQTNLLGSDLLVQLDPSDPLLALAKVIPWPIFEEVFARHCSKTPGAPAKLGRFVDAQAARKPQR